ncbi:MAG: PKD domain-containing protein [Bacteroidia bacterium]
MKYKILASFYAVLLFTKLSAQITINNADMPRANDTARVSTASGSINVNQTGADFTWNFANLNISSQDVIKYLSPTQTPYALFFTQATYGIPEQNINISTFILQEPYGFYRNTNTASVFMGRGASLQGIPSPVNYSPRDTIYRFPLTYGKKDSSNFAANANLVLANLITTGKRVNEVDGWGKITTPFGTFDCIRVKSSIQQTDSVVLSGFGLPIPNNRTEYKWLAKGQKYPVLQVVVTGGIQGGQQTITFLDRFRPDLFINNARFTANRTTTQIGDTINLTDQSAGSPTSWQWNITPNTFRFVAGTSATSQNPRIIFDALGKYTIKLTVNYNGGSDDTTRVDYISVVEGVRANFGSDKTLVDPTTVVNFYDSSTGNPTSWQWSFSPNTVSFVGSTSATSKNPKVVFNNAGNYSVTLRATGSMGSNTITKNNYIAVWPTNVKNIQATAADINLQPNPAKEFLLVSSNKNIGKLTLKVFDIVGKNHEVKIEKQNDNSYKINTDALPAGIYFIQLTNGYENITKKFVKE